MLIFIEHSLAKLAGVVNSRAFALCEVFRIETGLSPGNIDKTQNGKAGQLLATPS